MRVLILGHSAIARKRLIPALEAIAEIAAVEIASHSDEDVHYSDYESALAESSADLVYVSLVNSTHARWTERALESGRHVVVDKPAFLSLEEAERLTNLSRTRGLCLAEATVYTRHPQIAAARAQFTEAGGAPACIFASFSFPPLETTNFRYREEYGGGALHDLGPYAVSPGRIFWNERPEEVDCQIVSRDGVDGVETGFSVLLRYPKERSLVGHFGFTTAYRNQLSLLGVDRCVEVDRAFTTPSDFDTEIRISQQSGKSVQIVRRDDAFQLFLREVIERIETRDLDGLRRDLLDDAFVLDQMKRSAEGS